MHLIACSHGNGTERLRIVPLFVSLFYRSTFWNGAILFQERSRVNATPERSTFRNETIWTGTITFRCERGLKLGLNVNDSMQFIFFRRFLQRHKWICFLLLGTRTPLKMLTVKLSVTLTSIQTNNTIWSAVQMTARLSFGILEIRMHHSWCAMIIHIGECGVIVWRYIIVGVS